LARFLLERQWKGSSGLRGLLQVQSRMMAQRREEQLVLAPEPLATEVRLGF
jgi:hypothetical protein